MFKVLKSFLKRFIKTFLIAMVVYFCIGFISGVFGFSYELFVKPTVQIIISLIIFEIVTRKEKNKK
ncbi:MAG: hypothetical protein WCR79_01750 [Fusobacterium sp.]